MKRFLLIALAWFTSLCLVAWVIPGPTSDTQGTLSIGGGDQVSKIRHGQFTMNLDSLLAGTTLDAKVYVPGLDVAGNWVFIVTPLTAMVAGSGVTYARCVANDSLQVRFQNICSSGVNNPSMIFKWMGIK